MTTSRDVGLLASSDEEQLAYAHGQARVLITRDQDFLRLNAKGLEHSGMVYWTEQQRTVGQLIGAIDAMTIDHSSEDLTGRLFFL